VHFINNNKEKKMTTEQDGIPVKDSMGAFKGLILSIAYKLTDVNALALLEKIQIKEGINADLAILLNIQKEKCSQLTHLVDTHDQIIDSLRLQVELLNQRNEHQVEGKNLLFEKNAVQEEAINLLRTVVSGKDKLIDFLNGEITSANEENEDLQEQLDKTLADRQKIIDQAASLKKMIAELRSRPHGLSRKK
jgi:chromosome segregation ATPase